MTTIWRVIHFNCVHEDMLFSEMGKTMSQSIFLRHEQPKYLHQGGQNRIFGVLEQSYSVLQQAFLLPKLFSYWGIILSKGQLATIHYSAVFLQRQKRIVKITPKILSKNLSNEEVFPENWHFNSCFVFKTTKTPLFAFITQIL